MIVHLQALYTKYVVIKCTLMYKILIDEYPALSDVTILENNMYINLYFISTTNTLLCTVSLLV